MLGVELIAISELLLLALGPTHYEVTVGGGGKRRGGRGEECNSLSLIMCGRNLCINVHTRMDV